MNEKEIFDKVQTIISEQLGVEKSQVTKDANFANDLGADSLDTVELVMAIEEAFDIEIPDETAEKISNLQQAVDFISQKVTAQFRLEIEKQDISFLMYPIFIYDDNVFYKQKYKSVNKKELIDIVAKKSGMTKTETESLVTIALETIVESVAKGDRVTLVGFGSFEARERKARYGRNPQSGERLYIPPSRIPTFSVGNFFKTKVNNYFLDK